MNPNWPTILRASGASSARSCRSRRDRRGGRDPGEIIAQAKAMGLYGFAIPEEYGGLGLSAYEEVQLVLSWARRRRRSARCSARTTASPVTPCSKGGRRNRRRRSCPSSPAASGSRRSALTEPDAGSDPGADHPGRTAGRRLGDQRSEALHHQLAGGRRDHGLRADPTGRRPARACRSSWCEAGAPGLSVGPEGPQDGSGRRLERRRLPRRRAGAAQRHGRRAGRCGLRHRHAEPGARPPAHRRTVRRHGSAARAGVSRLRQGPTQGGTPIVELPAGPGAAGRLADGHLAARALVLDAPRDSMRASTSSSPRLRPSTSPAKPSVRVADRAVQIHGARGTSGASPWSASTAMPVCSASTRGPARSSSWSSPARCSHPSVVPSRPVRE